jgi:enhancing lycopene biosynthesis protein 2
MPKWAHLTINDIDFQRNYILRSTKIENGQIESLDDIDPEVSDTFNKFRNST